MKDPKNKVYETNVKYNGGSLVSLIKIHTETEIQTNYISNNHTVTVILT